jgi:dTDP-4-dehydrorhamnose reductase
MNEASILITGARGQLGSALQARYPGAIALDSDQLDITNEQAVTSYDWSGVSYILNAAAYTNVDGAETNDGRIAAWRVNAFGPANLVRIANEHNITIVHISSDYVFDGTILNHLETEPLSPLGVYGQTKSAGDIALSLSYKYYILRASWVIGSGKNFVKTMLGLGAKGIAPTVVADQLGRLTFTSELVRAIDHVLTTNVPYGTYNVSNDGPVDSWAGITRTIFDAAGYDMVVSDTTTAQYFASKVGIAPRPLHSTLDLSKLHAIGFQSNNWQDDLAGYISKETAP